MPTKSTRCIDLQDELTKTQNGIQQVVPGLFRANEEMRNLENQIRQLDRKISMAETQRNILRSAPRVFGPGGAIVSGLGSLEADISI